MRERLVNERTLRNLTQEELAEALELSAVFIRKIEKGERNPSIKTMKKYQSFFDVRVTELFPDIFNDFDDTKCIKDTKLIG
ncbi:helix-turn-helix transcriptional regulator [Bacillus tropicus]|uniref:Helix-turn-helix transcriptional regulator n=1 Tax=Bacillus tropicus TaxID=2026188 RepID=A0ABD7ZVN0_9BACI|nr:MULTISPECIES: helix-turn-helix transcriptional regulator [Bacillus]MCU4999503.1 helix-turn-helix domain-containing protein [Bacillus tropicus]UBM49731.1 helix-turn-helix domain-containing protein [Bacillus sp. CRB-7]WMY17160.1 helix-turn-helix transcriptional regulator [Bacillus tropicus]